MDGTNHSRGSTIQSLSPDKREDLEHELRPEALASIAREENAEASTNTTHAAVSSDSQHASENQPKNVLNNQVKATLAWSLSNDELQALRRLRILIVHGAKDLVVRPSSARQFHQLKC